MNVNSFVDLKNLLQDVFEGNEDSLIRYGKTSHTQLKTYLVESNAPLKSQKQAANWTGLDVKGWYRSTDPKHAGALFLDATGERVWRLFSLMDASEADLYVEEMVERNKGLDKCWLSRNHLMAWSSLKGWKQRGIGLSFEDGLAPEEKAGNFSLKAWHGADRFLPELEELIDRAKEKFAIHSVRWQKREGNETVLSTELYSTGKITMNRATDVDEALNFSAFVASRYERALMEAERAKSGTLAPFELDFAQTIDLEAFAETVTRGRGPMNLWLTLTESHKDFKRFRGVDMHNWDRVLLDVGPDFAYLTVPGAGCVNAAPRLATIQGENNAGRTVIRHDGVEIFA